LGELLDDPAPTGRAAEIGRLVRAEDGAAVAGDAIEALLARRGGPPATQLAPGPPTVTPGA
jgi:hypothetical protein